MNVFRLIADLSHLLAIVVLMIKIWKTKSCAGISGKSQVMYALVFITRYLDLFTNFVSPYNTVMKVLFIVCTCITVYFIFFQYKDTYDSKHDTFRMEVLLILALGLGFLINHDFTFMEITWTFSEYLESVLMLPQMFMIFKMGKSELPTTLYLIVIGSYRALYGINWIWRYHFEGFFDLEAIVPGCVQTAIYIGFFLTAVLMKVPLLAEKTTTKSMEEGKNEKYFVEAVCDKLPLIENEFLLEVN